MKQKKLKKKPCIEHYWESGTSHPEIVLKYGSFARMYEVCAFCGKRRLA